MSAPVLQARGVTVRYGRFVAVEAVDVALVAPGVFDSGNPQQRRDNDRDHRDKPMRSVTSAVHGRATAESVCDEAVTPVETALTAPGENRAAPI